MADAAPATHPDEPLVRAYLEVLAHQRRLARGTLGNYARDLAALLRLSGGARLASLEVVQLRRFVGQLHAAGVSGRSLAGTLSAWRGLYRWLARQRGFRADPCRGVRAPRSAKTLPKALSVEAAQRLLDAPQTDSPALLRDRAMFELMYSSGLRLAELVSLDAQGGALDLAQAEVTVTGKGGKTRSVPVGAKARAALRDWLAARAQLARP
ncbi:MAG TPA: tyrosine-type recombinase/integrase, partial [Burkholderiales bacterium]|nr:tyrosine-type recombinase/integrase [Burkholderiales bacterium]